MIGAGALALVAAAGPAAPFLGAVPSLTLLGDLAGVLAAAALCGAWVLVQTYFARHDPEQPGVEGCCGGCHQQGGCRRRTET